MANAVRLKRLTRAQAIVTRYSRRHVVLDLGLGAIGSMPSPWMGTASVGAAVALQAPVIYQPMVRQLCALYGVPTTDRMKKTARRSAIGAGAVDLAGEFGLEFVAKHIRNAAADHGIGLASSAVPIIGGVAGAIIDVKIAKEVTRLVGVMTLLYLENPVGWIGSKRSTYKLVRGVLYKHRKTPVAQLVEGIIEAVERDAASAAGLQALHGKLGDSSDAIIDSLVVGAPLADDANNVSQPVIDAVEHLRHQRADFDVRNLQDIAEALRRYRERWAAQFAGHVGDMVAHDQTPGSTLPASASQEAYDLIDRSGIEWQVKTGKTAASMARDHIERHPDIPIITNEDAADELHDDHLRAVGMSDLDTEHLRHMVDSTTVSIKDLADAHPALPIVSTILAANREASRWKNGEISASQMVENIAVRVGSRSLSVFILTSGLVLLATCAGIIAGAGPLIAGAAIVGGMVGNEVADELVDRSVADRILSIRLPVGFANNLVVALQSAAHPG